MNARPGNNCALVTGADGFIGRCLCRRLRGQGCTVLELNSANGGVCVAENFAAFAGQGRNIFLNGVLSFGVTVVACFGHESEQIVGPLFPPGAGDPEVRVLALPTPEELLILLPHELHRAVAQLKTLPLP